MNAAVFLLAALSAQPQSATSSARVGGVILSPVRVNAVEWKIAPSELKRERTLRDDQGREQVLRMVEFR